ncbi:MAG: DUF4388 domain-containing protein [Nitrospira sp.]|nr:DUF4388 domain-containing protein [Nitrospira sp.]
MALEGSIKDFGIADILQLINLQKKSGMLFIQDGEASVTINFYNGEIVYALSATMGENEKTGRLLISSGKLTEKELEDALFVQKNTGEKIGHVLVATGNISREVLQDILQVQVKDIIFKLFRWKNGWYKFDAQPVEYEKEYQIPIPTDFILLEGIRMLDEWPYIESIIPADNIIFTQSRKRTSEDKLFSSLGTEEINIFNIIDGQKDVKAITQVVNLTEFEVYKTLAALKVSGLISETYLSETSELPVPELPMPELPEIEEPSPSYEEKQQIPEQDIIKEKLEKGRLWTAVQLAILTFIVSFVFFLFPIGEIGGINSFITAADSLKKITAEKDLNYLRVAIRYYQTVNGTLPASLDILNRGHFIREGMITDPWGNKYVFEVLPQGYRLYSRGQDGLSDSGVQ